MFLNYYRGSQCKWNNGDAERNDYVITRNISYFKKYYQNEKNRNIKETTKKNEEGEEDTGDELLGSNKQPVYLQNLEDILLGTERSQSTIKY